MDKRQLDGLALARGESQRVLVAAGTTLLVVSGRLALRGPLQWLAGTVFAPEQTLVSEQTVVIDEGGWIDLVADDAAEVMLLPAGQRSFWQGLARCLGSVLGAGGQPAGRLIHD